MNTKMIEVPLENDAQLRRQLMELDSLYRKSPNGVAFLDHELHYVRVNAAMAEFHGLKQAAFTGREVHELLRDLPDDFLSRFHDAVKSDRPLTDIELTLENGARAFPRHFLAHFYLLDAAGDDEVGIGLVMVDVTERKLANEALRLSEARYREMVEHSVYGVCIVNAMSGASGANTAMLRILGCASQEEFISLNFLQDVFRYQYQQAQLFAACKEQGALHNAEAEWRRRDGGLVAVRLHLRRLAAGGDRGDLEIIAEDVTELRALERQLQQAAKV